MPARKKKATTAARPKTVRNLRTTEPRTDECAKAALILRHTHESCVALFRAYQNARYVRAIMKDLKDKGSAGIELRQLRGMTTDEEQDLLRAMLVMAASGLDAMLKQLIRDALPELLTVDGDSRAALEDFVRRRIRGETDDIDSVLPASFLAQVLVASSVQSGVIEAYVKHLRKGSLQSTGELSRVLAAFALSFKALGISDSRLKPIFSIRNKIIHELDVNLDAPRRKRNVRGQTEMLAHTNSLIEVAEKILYAIDKRVGSAV